ncbi:MAG: hypothetical protein LBU45_09410 [Azoarcus sp.]|jgi:hypothetical protein|nr:hypothetical protein [Azoarcus sp.]
MIRTRWGKLLLEKEVFSLPTETVDNFVGKTGTEPGKLRHCDKSHILPNHEAIKYTLLINKL